jgi:Ca-activated chloride channel family protein
MMQDIKFAQPYYFWLLLIIPLMILFYFLYLRRKSSQLRYSGLSLFKGIKPTIRQRLFSLPFILKLLAFILAIVALARPQSFSSGQNVTTEGIDIMMALDISSSMLAEDLKPNRIEAAKKVAEDFIDSRPNDRIGLVVFGGESFTQCPLTTDHAVLKNLFSGIQSGILADGTAIGEGLATSVNRIKDSKARSKVIILLTDGVNNIGAIAPETAGEIAKTFGIRVYSIGVGTRGMAPYPFKTPFGIQYQNMEVQIDEDVLQNIATETDGKYFRATNTSKLKQIYDEIDRMEKTKIAVTEFKNHTEEFYPWALMALMLLLADIILRFTIFKSIP